ncbi:hypothetical protein [Citricoccus alkalitolerans]|uniref:HPt domain-containing protein n=1 Tax=Citricoccus alkalitolerans TaxID=246603 RepID=A0ABV8XVG2_9MICC
MTIPNGGTPVDHGLMGGTMFRPVIDPDVVCSAVGTTVDVLFGDEQQLRLLEAAAAQLYQVVQELRLVGTGTREVADSVHSLSALDWRSPAGAAFLGRSDRLRGRAADLAELAEESAALARVAIDELHGRIGQLRASIGIAKATAASAVTLGMC